jgi:hypothetical protein
LPVTDQLTRHTGALNECIRVGVHGPSPSSCFQIKTHLSSEQLATILKGIAVFGAHATSRTQSDKPEII